MPEPSASGSDALAATWLTAVSDPDGWFAVLDAAGTEVLTAGPAVMWDSAGTSSAVRAKALAATDLDMPDGVHRADLPTTVSGDQLVVTPDAALLQAANRPAARAAATTRSRTCRWSTRPTR